ncbi:Mu transposase domain-containing protein [Nonomuraea sp. 10N515B]|uniref:Mu transposase domain-containing protein n=1 Tax=Nonomuraea sp. 10N515B TaxID=3457422 RepID=UPI003FCDB49B
MLTQGEDVEAHALRKRGWSISAIARHLNRDRKTIAAYLNGNRVPGQRRSSRGDPFAEFEQYCRIRLAQDPHLLAMTLFDEIVELGYAGGYSTFTRAIRKRGLRPHCEPCQQARGRDVAIISHEPGAEVQWDWLHLPDPPAGWAWPRREAYLLVGSLPYSGRWRGWLSPSMDAAHLIRGLHEVSARLGGLPLAWRFDRMATVVERTSGDVLASFAPVLKYYGVAAAICRPRRAQRKGAVEKANDSAAQRWWRTLAEEVTPAQAQASLDAWCRTRGDVRVRWADRAKTTVASVAAAEPLASLPERPYPALLEVERVVSAQGLVGFDGNHYSVPPGHRDQHVLVRWRLDETVLEIISAAGNTLARHRLAVRGAHEIVRAEEHVRALEKAVLAATGVDRAPCRRKKRIPPSQQALAEAERIRTARQGRPASPAPASAGGNGLASVTDFAAYAAAARALGPASSSRQAGQDEKAGRP